MRILVLAQHFAPEDVSGAALATQLAVDLVRRGHSVAFATCFPSYPKGVVFDGYRGKFFARETLSGVNVIRTWSYTSPLKTNARRLINQGTFSAAVLLAGLAGGRPDVILSYSPPLPLGLTAWFLSCLWQVPWVLRVEDLFPEAAIAAGAIRSRRVIRILEMLERFLYRRATHISLISSGIRGKLLSRGVPTEKMSVIPAWADPDEVKPMAKQTGFRREYGWQDKFVMLYAGNMGFASALEEVLAAAVLLKEQKDIHFVLIGEGVKKADFEQTVRDEHLENVTLLPYQPRERLSEVLASADVAIVTLNAASSSTSLPSKTFAYMASGRPILAVAASESDVAEIVVTAACGLAVSPGQPEQIANAILELKGDSQRLADMGQRSRNLLESQFSLQHCVDLFEQTLAQAAR